MRPRACVYAVASHTRHRRPVNCAGARICLGPRARTRDDLQILTDAHHSSGRRIGHTSPLRSRFFVLNVTCRY